MNGALIIVKRDILQCKWNIKLKVADAVYYPKKLPIRIFYSPLLCQHEPNGEHPGSRHQVIPDYPIKKVFAMPLSRRAGIFDRNVWLSAPLLNLKLIRLHFWTGRPHNRCNLGLKWGLEEQLQTFRPISPVSIILIHIFVIDWNWKLKKIMFIVGQWQKKKKEMLTCYTRVILFITITQYIPLKLGFTLDNFPPHAACTILITFEWN